MAMVQSTMLPLGTRAPDFALPDTEGKVVKLSDLAPAKGYLIAFICNHCPFVIHVRPLLAKKAKEFQEKGIAVVGINSNDISTHPADSPEKMKEEKAKAGYTFPYLFDESQDVARAYRAACTPDFFLFDADQRLYYRGQFDDSRPGNDRPLTGADLSGAVDLMLAGQPQPMRQKPSAGCNIKWKPGKEPDYFSH